MSSVVNSPPASVPAPVGRAVLAGAWGLLLIICSVSATIGRGYDGPILLMVLLTGAVCLFNLVAYNHRIPLRVGGMVDYIGLYCLAAVGTLFASFLGL